VKQKYPDVIFLAEAFTRPRVMYRLAKLGFSQSYTYFTWRNTKEEIAAYFQELTQSEVREYFRPNLWPSTPDILPEHLQSGGRAAFLIRFSLAATLGGSYGIYGPAFELCENHPLAAGGEEFLDSEKYQLKHRNLDSPISLRNHIASINQIRRENPALQGDWGLHFHETDNPLVICYSKTNEDSSNIVVMIVSLDSFHAQRGWARLDLRRLGLDEARAFQAHDLLDRTHSVLQGSRVYFDLSPNEGPARILRLQQSVRTEKEFDYYFQVT
jgi:starch synthase (maltosyl-transferring)